MGTLYEQNVKREIELCELRDAVLHGSLSMQAREFTRTFEQSFALEHKAFLALKNNASATQNDYNHHFAKAQNLLDEYMRTYNMRYNEGRNAFFLTREEAARYKEQCKQKMKALKEESYAYNRILLAKHGQNEYFYHNADRLIDSLNKEINERIDNEYYQIGHSDTKAFALYIQRIFSRYYGYVKTLKYIKANAML